MDLKTALEQKYLKNRIPEIVQYVVHNEIAQKNLFKLILETNYRINQNATKVILKIADSHPQIIQLYLPTLIKNLVSYPNVGIRRNTLRILQFQEIPKKQLGILTKVCFDYLISKEEPIAVKVFAMSILTNITKYHPDLKNELIIVIHDLMEMGSAGIQSRGMKMLRLLEKQSNQ